MAISNLPPAPQRSDSQQVFTTKADNLVAALSTFVTEANSTASTVNSQASAVASNTTAAAGSASAADTSASNAAGSATAAATAASAAAWVNGGTYALNASAISPSTFQTYRKKTASSVTTVDPANDSTNWVLIGALPYFIDSRTTNTPLAPTDIGRLISCTGTFTQTFAAAVTLGSRWSCYIKNDGTGDITLDPSGSETIDGLTSFVMYPGEMRIVECNGVNMRSSVLSPFYRVWTTTSAGNFVRPPGYNYFEGLAWSGGASGAKGGSQNAVGGGGGGCFPFKIESAAFGATATITIGAGGAAQTSSNTEGNPGGNTDIAGLITVIGGVGGTASTSSGGRVQGAGNAYGNFDSTGTGGNSTVYGGLGAGMVNGAGGISLYGGAGGGSQSGATTYTPGTSLRGGAGGAASDAGNGTAGTVPGGGGGATNTGTQSGAGARGEVRMWGVC